MNLHFHLFIIASLLRRGLVLRLHRSTYVYSMTGKVNWSYGDQWINIGIKGWIKLIDCFSDELGIRKKAAYQVFPKHTSIGKLRGIIKRKTLGSLKLKTVFLNLTTLNKGLGTGKTILIALVALLPISYLINYIYSHYQRRNNK